MDSQITRYAMLALYMLTMFLIASVLHRVSRHYGPQQIQSCTGHKLLRLQGRIQDMVVRVWRSVREVPAGCAINCAAAADAAHAPGPTRHRQAGWTPLPKWDRCCTSSARVFEDAEGVSSEVFLFPV